MLYQLAFKASIKGVPLIGDSGCVLGANQQVCRLPGCAREEVRERSESDLSGHWLIEERDQARNPGSFGDTVTGSTGLPVLRELEI